MTSDARDLGPLDLSHRPLVDARLAAHPPAVSEHTFTNLFVWRHSRPIRLLETEESLIVVEPCDGGAVIVGPPIGRLALPEAIRIVESTLDMPVLAVERVPERTAQEAAAAGLEAVEDRANFDYVYRREALATLSGRDYHGKRNLIAQCTAEHACSYEEITEKNHAEVREMMERWCAARGCGKDAGLCSEYLAIRELLDHPFDLNVIVSAIRVDGRIEAFTAGGRLTETTAVVHFEKAAAEIKGLYQLINNEFCIHEAKKVKYVNHEQDMGVDGLRKAKESYQPVRLVETYRIRKTPSSTEV